MLITPSKLSEQSHLGNIFENKSSERHCFLGCAESKREFCDLWNYWIGIFSGVYEHWFQYFQFQIVPLILHVILFAAKIRNERKKRRKYGSVFNVLLLFFSSYGMHSNWCYQFAVRIFNDYLVWIIYSAFRVIHNWDSVVDSLDRWSNQKEVVISVAVDYCQHCEVLTLVRACPFNYL